VSTPYIGEIRQFSFDYAPAGWAFCDSQVLDIKQNPGLFALLGFAFGGDQTTTFALPDLRGRVALGAGPVHKTRGQAFGEVNHTLTEQEMPTHLHNMWCKPAVAGNAPTPQGTMLSGTTNQIYAQADPKSQPVSLTDGTVGYSGNGEPHQNMAPSMAISFCIALTGVTPTRG
jgi:microcystin-dependent protein